MGAVSQITDLDSTSKALPYSKCLICFAGEQHLSERVAGRRGADPYEFYPTFLVGDGSQDVPTAETLLSYLLRVQPASIGKGFGRSVIVPTDSILRLTT